VNWLRVLFGWIKTDARNVDRGVRTARAPLDGAMTQNNLGNALAVLGEHSDAAALRRKVEAYRAALLECIRARVPFDSATTQNDFDNVLAVLGERSDVAALRWAVEAYEAALVECTRARVPLDWATTQNNLGIALIVVAERLGDETIAQSAVQQIEAAFVAMRDGGNAPAAAYYEAQLLAARELVGRLYSLRLAGVGSENGRYRGTTWIIPDK
jgi:hypothetical protein